MAFDTVRKDDLKNDCKDSGHVRPRQGTDSSAISGRRLHWRLSTGFFAFSPGSLCILVRRAPKNLEKVAKNPVEKIASNPVTSVAVMVFLAPKDDLKNNFEDGLAFSKNLETFPLHTRKMQEIMLRLDGPKFAVPC